MPVIPLHSLTSQSLDAKFAKKQRRYESKFSASFLHHPSPPPRLAELPRAPNPTFEALRAAAARLDLPEEDEQHGPPVVAAVPAAQRRPTRKALLGMAATLALCALAAGSYRAGTASTSEGGASATGATLAGLAHRFHDLVASQAVLRAMSLRIALLLPGPSVVRPANPAAAQAEPGAFPPAAAIASPDAAEVAASAPPGVAAQQLADTFALVKQMGLLMRDMQVENEGLHTQVAGLTGVLRSKVTDLEQRQVATARDTHDLRGETIQLRAQVATLADTLQASSKATEQRLSFALARNPAGAASEPDRQQAEAPAPPASTSAGDGSAVATAAAAGFARTARDYQVQAASFGMAVLGNANPAPGQGVRYLVAVGDQVPGVGRVTSITQHGTSWVVQTDHGAIQ